MKISKRPYANIFARLKSVMEAIENSLYPFDPSLERSLRILDHIHLQRETFEGIKIPASPFRNKKINGSAQ
jgi:hypothetical protein